MEVRAGGGDQYGEVVFPLSDLPSGGVEQVQDVRFADPGKVVDIT